MPEASFAELAIIAFQKERVAARRLHRQSGLSQDAALRQILQAVAGTSSLIELINLRHQSAAQAKQALAHRRQAQVERRASKVLAKIVSPQSWQGWFDGSATPNPGKIGLGAVLRSPDGRQFDLSRTAGEGDSNQAECLALIALLECAQREKIEQLVIFGDSQIVIAAVANGGSDQGFSTLRSKAQALMATIASVQLCWIPRHKNAAADALSQNALKQIV
jgi:ribonuclease HI